MSAARFRIYLILGGFLLFISIYGYTLLEGLPRLPQNALDSLQQAIRQPDTRISLDGQMVLDVKDLEFLLCRRVIEKQIGDSVLLEIGSNSSVRSHPVVLAPYPDLFPLSQVHLLIMGLSSLIAFLVLVLKRDDVRAQLLYWAILTFATAEVLTGGFHCLTEHGISYIPAVAYFVCYVLAPTILLHFSLEFDGKRSGSQHRWLYIPAILFIVLLEGIFLRASWTAEFRIWRIYQSVFYFFRLYLFLCVLAAVLNFILLYRKTGSKELQARLKWILYGLVLGLGPFILLYQLPRLLTVQEILSMEISMSFSLLVPVCAAIAVIRYKLLDIELVINRSLVYTILTVLVVGFYIFLARILHGFFSQFMQIKDTTVSALAAFGAALCFHPARRRLQEVVDRVFFRVPYDYRKCLRVFGEKAAHEHDPSRLAETLLTQIREVLPVEALGMEIQRKGRSRWKSYLREGEPYESAPLKSLFRERGSTNARKRAVISGGNVNTEGEYLLEAQGLELLLTLPFSMPRLRGYITMARKKSGERFSREDLTLLRTLAQEFSANLERLELQRQVILERAEKDKLTELNRLKTEFIAMVSHELRTPLSTLQGLAEVLHQDMIKDSAQRDKLLHLMSDECSRLSQFLHNILDSGKIERNVKSYVLKQEDLGQILSDTLEFYQHRLDTAGFSCSLEIPEQPVLLQLDRDAMIQALSNLVDNAIKYSGAVREIRLELRDLGGRVTLCIEDRGIGIPPKDRKKIFQGFYRGEEATLTRPRGVGIGLKIVHHIIRAHGGRIYAEGDTSQGSRFVMEFEKS